MHRAQGICYNRNIRENTYEEGVMTKRGIIGCVLVCSALAACGNAGKGAMQSGTEGGVRLQEQQNDTGTMGETEQSQKTDEKPPGYFDNLSSYCTAEAYVIQGSVQNANRERRILITDVIAKENAEIRITGSMECMEGAARIVYVAQDGTETVLTEADAAQVDVMAAVSEGDGYLCFAGETEDFCYHFLLNFELSDAIDYFGEDLENTEDESLDVTDGIDGIADGTKDLPEDLTDNFADMENDMEYSGTWETGLGRKDENFTAKDWSLLLTLDESAVLEIENVTDSGRLDVRVLYSDGSVYYSEENMETGCSYVELDQVGTYVISIWAEEHTGSFSFCLVR